MISAAGCFLAVLGFTACLLAADQKIYTQKPEILTGEAAKPAVKEPPPSNKLFKNGPKPLWIWGAEDNRRYVLRKEFEGGSTAARLKATCDNRMKLSLNGREIASSAVWETPVEVDVQKFLKPGKNVLEAEVSNAGGVAGFVLKLVLSTDGEKTRYVVSDESWQATERKKNAKTAPAARLLDLAKAPGKMCFPPHVGPAHRHDVPGLAGISGRAAVHRAAFRTGVVGLHRLR